tara:strand:+ start:208 stop:324 length:117 start_codon:yes stop_codon:yes gene_type:complete
LQRKAINFNPNEYLAKTGQALIQRLKNLAQNSTGQDFG